jgi:hypothetical protein
MKTQYAVLNPATGSYQFADTLDEVPMKMAEVAFAFYMSQTAETPLSIVQTHDSGAETWFAATGERIPPVEDVVAQMRIKLQNIQSMRDAATLDVTRLGE